MPLQVLILDDCYRLASNCVGLWELPCVKWIRYVSVYAGVRFQFFVVACCDTPRQVAGPAHSLDPSFGERTTSSLGTPHGCCGGGGVYGVSDGGTICCVRGR